MNDQPDDLGSGRSGGQPPASAPTRRTVMLGGALGAAGVLAARAGRPRAAQARLIDDALSVQAAGASLSDIEHVVILMQENRSFDHYFGTLSGVRGFSDPAVPTRTAGGQTYPVYDQFGYQPGTGPDASGYLQPFHLVSNPPLQDGQTTNDISHSWQVQHQAWNGGGLDAFVTAHLAADGSQNGPVTMGYYTRQDLAFYYALADAFTVCDSYFCSVLGPADPNRLMAMSASIGRAGGTQRARRQPGRRHPLPDPVVKLDARPGVHSPAPARAILRSCLRRSA